MGRGWEAITVGWPVLDFHQPFRPLLGECRAHGQPARVRLPRLDRYEDDPLD
jgi:hypothetical protein